MKPSIVLQRLCFLITEKIKVIRKQNKTKLTPTIETRNWPAKIPIVPNVTLSLGIPALIKSWSE